MRVEGQRELRGLLADGSELIDHLCVGTGVDTIEARFERVDAGPEWRRPAAQRVHD